MSFWGTGSGIEFPGLSLYFNNVPKGINIFGVSLTFSGILIVLGIVAGILITLWQVVKTEQNKESYIEIIIYILVAAIIGARVGFVIVNWSMYSDNPMQIFNFRYGGLSVYGCIAAAVAAALLCSRIKKLNAPLVMDTMVIGLLTFQMMGRLGDFFNRSGLGEYTDGVFAMRLKITDVNMKYIQAGEIDRFFIQVHPIFLYEILWCACILILINLYKNKKKYDGELILIYFATYCAGRFWMEGLTADKTLIFNDTINISQIICGISALVAMIFIAKGRYKYKKNIDKAK